MANTQGLSKDYLTLIQVFTTLGTRLVEPVLFRLDLIQWCSGTRSPFLVPELVPILQGTERNEFHFQIHGT